MVGPIWLSLLAEWPWATRGQIPLPLPIQPVVPEISVGAYSYRREILWFPQ